MTTGNTASPPDMPSLMEACAAQFASLKAGFETTGDGAQCLAQRSAHVDWVIRSLYAALISPQLDGPEGLCLVAAGGYGRKELFPFSDLDLYFVARDEAAWKPYREAIAVLARNLWDLQMRVSHSTRTLEECGRLHSGNLEFNVSLLDVRYLAGDPALFEKLLSQAMVSLIVRDGDDSVRNLLDKTAERHAKHGKTIFHLEPDVKEAPGGMRDYHTARWLARIAAMAESRRWSGPDDQLAAGGGEAADLAGQAAQAFTFLSATRCMLHFHQGRNDNLLTYELQDQSASLGLGVNYGKRMDAAGWMQNYYRHVRSIDRLTGRAIEDSLPSRSSLYSLFQDWRSRLSNADFSVLRGKIYPRSSEPRGWTALLSLVEMVARHSLELSRDAERWAEKSLSALRPQASENGENCVLPEDVWPAFRRLLALPGTAGALRAMHRLGVLSELIPGFHFIDALVIRDFFHRYTVDEHSFMTVQTLCELGRAAKTPADGEDPNFGKWKSKFAAIYAELEQPELLTLALILHDTGKGMPVDDHVEGSLEVAKSVCARLSIDVADGETIAFLIGRHLEMSATVTRRDIFDVETLRSFAAKMGTPERLKMLCLLTCADINAVNPEALTPWKAEMLWQLYAMTANYFARSVDQDRFQSANEAAGQTLAAEPAALAVPVLPSQGDPTRFKAFLDGFPRRYLAAHSPSEIGEHFEWAQKIASFPVQAKVRRRGPFNELTVLATDRPYLFASVAGTLAAWGMNILKAEALANSSGIVLDVFRFHDLHRTLEMNPSETARLEESIVEVLTGAKNVAALMKGRSNSSVGAKVNVGTQINFDDASSSRCTILEVITRDRPGLLYRVSSVLAELECNIEVALIETEAQKAVDIFYLTRQGGKLPAGIQDAIRAALIERLK